MLPLPRLQRVPYPFHTIDHLTAFFHSDEEVNLLQNDGLIDSEDPR
jgi:hypothetical protein